MQTNDSIARRAVAQFGCAKMIGRDHAAQSGSRSTPIERHELFFPADNFIQIFERNSRARLNCGVAFVVFDNGVQMPRGNNEIAARRPRADVDFAAAAARDKREVILAAPFDESVRCFVLDL